MSILSPRQMISLLPVVFAVAALPLLLSGLLVADGMLFFLGRRAGRRSLPHHP